MAKYYATIGQDTLDSIFAQLDADPERLPDRQEFTENILYDLGITVSERWDDAETFIPGRTDYRAIDFWDYVGTRYAIRVSFSRVSRILEIRSVKITAAPDEADD